MSSWIHRARSAKHSLSTSPAGSASDSNHWWSVHVLPGPVHALGNTRRRRAHCAAFLLPNALPARALGRHEVLAYEHRADQPAAAVSGAVAVARPGRPAGLAGPGAGPAVLHFARWPG